MWAFFEEGIDMNYPVQIDSLTNILTVAATSSHTLAVTKDGYVYAWGDNYIGQLGDGTRQERNTPVRVEGLSQIIAVTSGFAGWFIPL